MKELSLKVGKYDLITLVSGHDTEAMVAVRPLCEALGVASFNQQEKLKHNPQFNCHDRVAVGADGKQRQMLCIPITEVGMWLCTINARKVKDSVRERLIVFQKHLQLVIYKAMTGELTLEYVKRLEQMIHVLAEENKQLREDVNRLVIRSDRFERIEASASASRLSSQRWANRDVENLH